MDTEKLRAYVNRPARLGEKPLVEVKITFIKCAGSDCNRRADHFVGWLPYCLICMPVAETPLAE